MAQLGNMFDANNVEPTTPYVALPPGEYIAQAIASAMEATKRGDGRFLKFEFEVVDGEQAGRKIIERFNLENPNSTAVEIAQRQFSGFCRAAGVMTVSDSEQLHFKKVRLKVATVPRKDKDGNLVPGEFSNEIKAYMPAAGATGSSTTSQRAGFTPGAAAGGTSTAPWKRQA